MLSKKNCRRLSFFNHLQKKCKFSKNKLKNSDWGRLVVTKQKCWANEQYSRRECLEISGIPESVNDNVLEDKIQGVLLGIDVDVDKENIESCYCLKGKGNKGKVILKLSKREDADKIKSNTKIIKNIDHKKIGLSSGTKYS